MGPHPQGAPGWRAAFRELRLPLTRGRGSAQSVWLKQECVCTCARRQSGPSAGCAVTKALGRWGGQSCSSQILCLWIHLLTKVCGLDINTRGASAVMCRRVWRHLRVAAGGAAQCVQDTGTRGPSSAPCQWGSLGQLTKHLCASFSPLQNEAGISLCKTRDSGF